MQTRAQHSCARLQHLPKEVEDARTKAADIADKLYGKGHDDGRPTGERRVIDPVVAIRAQSQPICFIPTGVRYKSRSSVRPRWRDN
jgi:hypothetical protein